MSMYPSFFLGLYLSTPIKPFSLNNSEASYDDGGRENLMKTRGIFSKVRTAGNSPNMSPSKQG